MPTIIGSVPPLAMLALLNWTAFRTPLPVGYEHSALWQEQHDTGFLSITYPHLDAIWGISFSPFRGLFYFAPILLLAIVGSVIALRDSRERTVTLMALISFLGMFLFVSSSSMWWGGFAVGPRYLVPAVPFLAVPLGALLARMNAMAPLNRLVGLGSAGLLAAVSAAIVMATTFARQNYPPDSVRRTMADYVLPALRDDDVARNVAMTFELRGLISLIPLGVVLAIGVMLIAQRLLSRQVTTA